MRKFPHNNIKVDNIFKWDCLIWISWVDMEYDMKIAIDINIFRHGAIIILNKAVKFWKFKCGRFYKMYEEQRQNIKDTNNFSEMCG
jgi:hypothetical protein